MIKTNSSAKNRKKTQQQQKSNKDIENKNKSKKGQTDASGRTKDRSKVNNKSTTDNATDKTTPVNAQQNKTNKIISPELLPVKKLERSNSFFLTRKLSKIYNTLTGSKESLNKIPENDDHHPTDLLPFKFTRSASLGIIPLRKSYRRSIRESKLEQLNEEHVSDLQAKPTNEPDEQKPISKPNGETQTTASDSNASRPYASTECLDKSYKMERKNSFNLLSSLKRTFSVTPNKRKKSYNSKWTASLMNLQQIDHMISYEDLSFIDYDKFNTYEANLIRHLSQTDVRKQTYRQSMPDADSMATKYEDQLCGEPNEAQDEYFTNYPTVKRRPRKTVNINDVQSNFDKPKNVYRQSLDDEKLKYLSNVNRKSYRWSNPFDEFNKKDDVLPCVSNTDRIESNDFIDGTDTIDGNTFNEYMNNNVLNKKSITIERCISCNSLRRTQSMNDISTSADIRTDDNKVSNLSCFAVLLFQTFSA